MPETAEGQNSRGRPKVAPGRRKTSGRWLFALLVLAIGSAILATVLLANDMQNLRAIYRHYGLPWPLEDKQVERAPRPLKGKRLIALPIKLPDHVLAAPEMDSIGALVRDIRRPGDLFCAAFADNGMPNGGWQPSQFDKTTFECLSETLIPSTDEAAQNASFFFIAKGDPDGNIGSIRMKLVAPDTDAGKTVHAMLVRSVELLIEQTQWGDLAEAVEHATRLEDFQAVRFGLSFKFTREFTAPNRFNLIVLPTGKTPAIKATRAYFARQDWLPVPSVPVPLVPISRLPIAPAR
ncbi:hypothetical protein HGO38_04720 [Rhizobium sp. CG5]|uniref:DUF6030 family protein n=1 Tax=Rhizobium sp. CG5 TaxID=2726076 RepID=UPI00203386B7|nr:DUF6030 family protein [Rhizobium sp. CG5]MCM2472779.1 hypothetical protein [Rhizobium sp. CG5]